MVNGKPEAIRASIREQVEIAIIELLSLSTNGNIIVDGIFPVSVLKQISSKDRVVFLMADMPTISFSLTNFLDPSFLRYVLIVHLT